MADSTPIREFLVSLGFNIKKSEQKDFVDSVTSTTVKVVALGAATAATAAAVVAGVARIADNLERLYFASQRTNTTVENIQAIGYAADNLGASSESALGAIESIARLLRNSPGGEGLLKNIGVQTRDATGGLRDTGALLGDLGKRFAGMPYYRANAYAQALGIDEKTLIAMRAGLGQFSDEYKEMLRKSGVDAEDAARKSHEFMVQVRGIGAAMGLLTQKIMAGIADRLTGAIERFRVGFIANFGKIADAATKVLLLVFSIGDAIGHMVVRGMQVIGYLIDKWNGLSDGSRAIIKWIGLILLAWRALNAGFLSTPLGRIIALISALALLWDDYQTWKEGGKSLIDWSAWAPGIEKAIAGIKWLANTIHESLGFLGDWRAPFELLLAYVTGTWLFGMLGAIGRVATGLAATGGAGVASLAARTLPVAAAGAAGYAAGSLLYNKALRGSKAGDMIGGGVASLLSILGNKDAAYAVGLREHLAQAGAVARPDGAVQGAVARPVGAVSGARPNPNDPRGIRNNNPGNIEYGAWTRAHGAVGAENGNGGRFAAFATAQEGLNAIAALLRSKAYGGGGIDSVSGIISKYAPAKDKNNTAAYIATVAKKLSVGATAHLDLNNPQIMAGLVDAIVRVENGKNPYSRDMLDKAASGKGVQITQTTNITTSGAEPARQVEKAQNGVNDRLVRNMRGSVLQ